MVSQGANKLYILPIQEIAVEFGYSRQPKMKRLLSKDDNRKLWMEVVNATFMDAVKRIDALTAVMTYNLSELGLYIGKSKIVVSFSENVQTQLRLLVLANFISCLPS